MVRKTEGATRSSRGKYSRVTRRIWNSASFKALTHPEPCGGWLWFRLLTGTELTSIPGLFQAWEAGLAQALGWSLEGFRKAFLEVRGQGLAEADWATGLVWLPKGIEHNEPESPNVVSSWHFAWAEMPDCELKAKAYQRLESWAKAKGESWLKAFHNACPKPTGKAFAKTSRNHDHDQERSDPDLSQPAKDLTGLPARARESGLAGSDKPTAPEHPRELEAVQVIKLAARKPGERPTVFQELPSRSSPRSVAVPEIFETYAGELGLSSQTYRDTLTDWREKVGPSTHVRLFDVLCRFIESKARRPERSTTPSQPPPASDTVVAWSPPPEGPSDPSPPPPNPLEFPAKASNG